MKPIACRLIVHGQYKELDLGFFSSIRAAKRFINTTLFGRPYTIQRGEKDLKT